MTKRKKRSPSPAEVIDGWEAFIAAEDVGLQMKACHIGNQFIHDQTSFAEEVKADWDELRWDNPMALLRNRVAFWTHDKQGRPMPVPVARERNEDDVWEFCWLGPVRGWALWVEPAHLGVSGKPAPDRTHLLIIAGSMPDEEIFFMPLDDFGSDFVELLADAFPPQ